MKFVADRDILSSSLNIVLRGVSSRSTLPILKGILIKADKKSNSVLFSSSDLEISIETIVKAEMKEEGSIVVSAKLFSDVIRKLPAGEVEISLTEDNKIFIKSGKIENKLQGIPADEFPVIEKEKEEYKILFNGELFKEMIRRTAFAASIEETRGIITGVLFEINKNSAKMVALDGFRMAIVTENIKEDKDERKLIVKGRIINEVARIAADSISDENDDITINSSDNKIFFIIKGTKIVARLMEGDFIKYKDIIPKEKMLSIKINKNHLLESVERASLLVKEGRNSFVRFKIEGEELTITSRADEGEYVENIIVEKDGEDLEIGFNGRFVSDTLKAIDDEEIMLEFNKSINPCIVKPVEGEGYVYLILPVRLSTGNV